MAWACRHRISAVSLSQAMATTYQTQGQALMRALHGAFRCVFAARSEVRRTRFRSFSVDSPINSLTRAILRCKDCQDISNNDATVLTLLRFESD